MKSSEAIKLLANAEADWQQMKDGNTESSPNLSKADFLLSKLESIGFNPPLAAMECTDIRGKTFTKARFCWEKEE